MLMSSPIFATRLDWDFRISLLTRMIMKKEKKILMILPSKTLKVRVVILS